MARLWQSGFELNSSTEWTNIASSPSIQSTVVRSGTYSGRITSLSSGAAKGFLHQYFSGVTNGPYYARFYFRVDTLPSAANQFFCLSPNTTLAQPGQPAFRLTSSGTVQMFNNGSQVGSDSSALSTGVWYQMEMFADKTPAAGSEILTGRIDGVTFATSSSLSIPSSTASIVVGGNLASEAQTQGDWYFDDVAINDTTGSFQNSWPGEGKIMHLKPNATGDSNGFTVGVGGVAGQANNYTRVQEVTPDNATTYNGSSTLNAEDLFNCEDSGLNGSDTVNVVAVGVRMANLVSADATAAFKLEIEKTSGGTKAQSAALIPNSTTWRTNAAAVPRNYSLVTYQDPDSSNWTNSTLDSMQIGYIQTATNVQSIAVSTIWASVDYTPSAGGTAIKDIISSNSLLAPR